MEVVTVTAKGGDVAGKMRRLEGSLGQLCDSFEEVKRLAKDSQEAADKCQVRFGHVFFQKHVSRHAFLLSKRQVRFRHVFLSAKRQVRIGHILLAENASSMFLFLLLIDTKEPP